MLVAFGGVALAACAAGDARFSSTDPAGFWFGLWHGLIAPIAFVVGLFSDGVEIYERANSGAWYDLGFLFGLLCLWGGSRRSYRAWNTRQQEHTWELPERVTLEVEWKDRPEAPAEPVPEDQKK